MPEKELKKRMDEFYVEHELYQKMLMGRIEYLENADMRVGFLDIVKISGKKQKILDCGCGPGSLAIYLSKRLGRRTYGVDISKAGVQLAEKMAEKENAVCTFEVADIENRIPFPDDFFDLVIMHEVIEHLVYPEKAIGEVTRVLKNHGLLIVICPNLFFRSSPTQMLMKASQWIKMCIRREYLPKTLLTPNLDGKLGGDTDAVYLTNPIELRRMLNMCGLSVVRGSYIRCLFLAEKNRFNMRAKIDKINRAKIGIIANRLKMEHASLLVDI